MLIPTKLDMKLFQYAIFSADKYGANSLQCRIYLTELFYQNYDAYDNCCADIAAYIIGG